MSSLKKKFQRLKESVALEAAKFLYNGSCKEYVEAKKAAAQLLGISILPKNSEVALKLLEYALLMEGDGYWKKLENMRREAAELMEALAAFKPRLVGSVWRGIVKPSSDIDLEIDCQDPEPVKRALAERGYEVLGQESINVPEPLRYGSLWRIKVKTRSGKQAEIILKEHKWHLNPPKCDIFGDLKKGLNMVELRKVLKEEPAKLFIPRRRMRDGVR